MGKNGKRVVVTGMGGLSPIGLDWPTVRASLRNGLSGVVRMDDWDRYSNLETRLGAPVRGFVVPDHYPRKKTRSMGRVALMAVRASEIAIEDAGLIVGPELTDGTTGISYGSTSGSPPAMERFLTPLIAGQTLKGIGATDYVRFMSHTCAANLGLFFSIKGQVIPTCSACTSGSQGIGYGYMAIRNGTHPVMLTGGAEELHVTGAAVFDLMFATSTRNDEPTSTPRPFDESRDGMVPGEGAGTLILEDLDHARARKAKIHAEVIGFGTNCDGCHITNPSADGMKRVITLALHDAGLKPDDIDYVNLHGTATDVGDIAEAEATHEIFGERAPCSTLKSYMGHTLGACGALEAWMTIEMMNEGWFAPTLHLENVDERCAPLDHIRGEPRQLDAQVVMTNNFAFGGINTSLILRRWCEG
jgi:3-oxoacyl-[acyl-carrier-protein] synthase II